MTLFGFAWPRHTRAPVWGRQEPRTASRRARSSFSRLVVLLLCSGVLIAGCKSEPPRPGPSPFAPFVGTWFAGSGTPITYIPDIYPRLDYSQGAWIRIDADGGVRLGSSYGVHQIAQLLSEFADERGGRLELLDGGARIVWDWEDAYESDKYPGTCLPAQVGLTTSTPDASVLDPQSLVVAQPDGGPALGFALALEYGPFPPSFSGFVPVPDLGAEPFLTVGQLAGAWSNGLDANYSLDGGYLPNGDPLCSLLQTRFEVSPDAGLLVQRLFWSLGSGDVYATYSFTSRRGRLDLEGRLVRFFFSSVATETLVLHSDGSTELTQTTDQTESQEERRAWFGAPDQLWVSDTYNVPLYRSAPSPAGVEGR